MRAESVATITNAGGQQLFHLIDETVGKMSLGSCVDLVVKHITWRIEHK